MRKNDHVIIILIYAAAIILLALLVFRHKNVQQIVAPNSDTSQLAPIPSLLPLDMPSNVPSYVLPILPSYSSNSPNNRVISKNNDCMLCAKQKNANNKPPSNRDAIAPYWYDLKPLDTPVAPPISNSAGSGPKRVLYGQ